MTRKVLCAAALVAVLLLPDLVFAQSAVPISGLPSATTPLSTESVPIVQSGATKQVPADAFGIPVNSSTAPTPVARFQEWWDTSTTPPTLRAYDGTSWVAIGTLDLSAHAWHSTTGIGATFSFLQPSGTGQSASGIAALSTSLTGTVGVSSAAGWPSTGELRVDSEYVSYQVSGAGSITILTRGDCGSSGASHSNGASVMWVAAMFGCPVTGNPAWALMGDGTQYWNGEAQTPPPSGHLVGTTDTQTLTNKSIDASELNSGALAEIRLPNTFSVGKDFVGGILSPVIVDLYFFGVLCIGCAVDYGDIFTAISDWSGGNVRLMLPFGNCKVSAPVILGTNGANHVHLAGAGGMAGTTITATFAPVANQGIVIISAADPTVTAALEDDVSDLQITRAATATAQGVALQVLNCNTCNFHDLLIAGNFVGIEEAGGNANKFTRITSFGPTAYSGVPAGGAFFYVHSEPKSGGGTWEPFTLQMTQFNGGGGSHQQYGIEITACDGCQFSDGYLGAHPQQIYIVPETDASTFIDATEFQDIREDNADTAGAGGMCFEIDTNASRPIESFYGLGVYGGWCDNSTYGFVVNNKNANLDLVGIKGNTNNLVVLDNWQNVNIEDGQFLSYSGIGISSPSSSNCGYLTISGNSFNPGSGTSAITLGACGGGTPTATINGNNYNGLSAPETIDSSWSVNNCANVSSGKQLGCSGYNFAFKGSSSGKTIVQSAATASGTLTLPAATDTLVGRATTDALTNKSIDGSEVNSGTVSNSRLNIGTSGATLPLLNAANAWASGQVFQQTNTNPAGNSGSGTLLPMGIVYTIAATANSPADGTEDTIATYSLPANSLDVAGRNIRVTACTKHAGNTSSVTGKLYFGSVSLSDAGIATSGQSGCMFAMITKTGASTQNYSLWGWHGSSLIPPNTSSSSETDTSAIVIKFTTQNAAGSPASGDQTLRTFTVEYMN